MALFRIQAPEIGVKSALKGGLTGGHPVESGERPPVGLALPEGQPSTPKLSRHGDGEAFDNTLEGK
jgi:hypothetical protein